MIRTPLARTALAGVLFAAAAGAAVAQPPATTGVSPQTLKINEFVAKGWEAGGVKKPADKATDLEFMRRAYIDLIGRIATPEEVLDYERDKSPTRRAKLVNRLLTDAAYTPKDAGGKPYTVTGADGKTKTLTHDYTREYADHWADMWTVWLMTRTGNQVYREQMHYWLFSQIYKNNINHKQMVTDLITATGKTNENGAVNFLVHHLGEAITDDKSTPENEPMAYGKFDAVPVTSKVTKLFLGLQTQCTQCHDHPFNKEWVQADYWGVNTFFRQTVRSATPTPAPMQGNNNKMDNPVQITLTDDASLNPELIVLYPRRDGKLMAAYPTMLKDVAQADKGENSTKRILAPNSAKTRRQVLAEWVVSHDNFAKAYVNRAWAHFMGRGLNKEPSADDFGSNNEVVHPELLAYLAEQFAQYGYDPKKLAEWICTSDVYNLSHVAQKDYADTKFDPYFARMPLKAMSPEVLFESLMTATRAQTRIKADDRKLLRDQWMRKLVKNFGDDEGNELNFNGTVVQALLMMNGGELNGEIGVGKGNGGKGVDDNVIADVVKKRGGQGPAAIYDELFLMTLNRHPTPAEVAKLEDVRNGKAVVKLGAGGPPAPPPTPPKGKGPVAPPVVVAPDGAKVAPGAGPSDVGFYQDVFWALLNTNEFMLNH